MVSGVQPSEEICGYMKLDTWNGFHKVEVYDLHGSTVTHTCTTSAAAGVIRDDIASGEVGDAIVDAEHHNLFENGLISGETNWFGEDYEFTRSHDALSENGTAQMLVEKIWELVGGLENVFPYTLWQTFT